jgi:UDP-2,3-diacylglucosamine pyrophosphatase LpxH
MRLAFISDTHFGDPMGSLISKNDAGDYVPGDKYHEFKERVGPDNDYLVLVGDILDFSLVAYKMAYEVAKQFFLLIQKDNIAKEIIYIPGNHDAGMWHIVENEVNIILKLEKGENPQPFRFSVPGIIDDRKNTEHPGFTLAGVTAHPENGRPKYAGLYLDHITEPEGKPTIFNFAFPNLYIVNDKESILITHGHFLEEFWALAGEWSKKIANDDLDIGKGMNMTTMVGINFPLCQLACSGIGQAGPLTPLVLKVQREVKDGDIKRVKKYLNRFDDEIDKLLEYPWYKKPIEWLSDTISDKVKKMILEKLSKFEDARYSETFIKKEEVRNRFRDYYQASLSEVDELNSKFNFNIPYPQKVIFGHTHQPIQWDDPQAPSIKFSNHQQTYEINLFNMGGWLYRKTKMDKKEFCGAEIFIYDSDSGMRSVNLK